MSYPPSSRGSPDPNAALHLMHARPFAHFFTSNNGQHVTRIPFVTDERDGVPFRLRGHLDAKNPQAQSLDGAEALIAFSGPSTYVSPHWRIEKARGGTYDYEEVVARGTVRIVDDLDAFRIMIDDLSSLLEPQYAEAGDYPIWQSSMAAPGYIERLMTHLTQFVVTLEDVQMISKLHRDFPAEDRRSVADHLDRCRQEDARAIAEIIRQTL